MKNKFKFWKGPSHAHRIVMIVFVIGGFIGILMGAFLQDKEIILLSVGIIIMGFIFGGLQSIAWKQWEDQQKRKGREPLIFPTFHKFLRRKK